MFLRHCKKTVLWALTLALMLALAPLPAQAAGGDGTEDNPYLISNLAALEDFRDSVNSGNTGVGEYFKLTADIDMSEKYSETTGVSWEMIGNTQESAFQGTFDGGGHTIRGLYIHKTGPGGEYGLDEGALFGCIDGGTMKNLNVQGYVSVAASNGSAAGIAIAVEEGAILNCTFDGIVESPNYIAGGITAECIGGVISGCKTSGKITGTHLVAGMVGTDAGGACTITNCVNESEIIGTTPVGGIAGSASGKIEGCVNRGSVTGRSYRFELVNEEGQKELEEITSSGIGGIAGYTQESSVIENCSNIGAVSGNTNVGGICGKMDKGNQESEILASVKNCFNAGWVASSLETDGGHSIGAIAGTIVSEVWDHDAGAYLPGVVAADVSNCYYLAGTADKGIAAYGDGADSTTVKTADEFASGEVAYLLQESNVGNVSAIVWGQKLAVDEMPVLTDNAEKAVYQVTFVTEETEYARKYANPSSPIAPPKAPAKSGYTFGGWYKEAAYTNAWDFTADTFTADRTLYAKWTKNSTGGDHSAPTPSPKPDEPVITVDQFADVKTDAWYYEAVKYAVDNGLFYGTGETTFSPNDQMSRGMLLTVLYRAEKEPETVKNAFSDVEDGKYYTEAIAWASEQKIVSGYGNGKFGPEDNITREQLATILYRWAGEPETTGTLDTFKDNEKVRSYAKTAFCWAYERGIIAGKGNGVLDPLGKATRAEAAAMLMRYFMAM